MFQAAFHKYLERKDISMIEKKAYETPKVEKLEFDFKTTVTASAPQVTYTNRDEDCETGGGGWPFAEGYAGCTAWSGPECNLDDTWG